MFCAESVDPHRPADPVMQLMYSEARNLRESAMAGSHSTEHLRGSPLLFSWDRGDRFEIDGGWWRQYSSVK